MTKKIPEREVGGTVYRLPIIDPQTFETIKPLIVKQPYSIDYIHSFGQDSSFFAYLSNGKLLGSQCPSCNYTYATPKGHCMECEEGPKTRWVELPLEGRIHTWTTCYYGSQEFLEDIPYNLILVEFDHVDTLFLSRLVGVPEPYEKNIYIGMPVRAQFRRLAEMKVTDVYFVPKE